MNALILLVISTYHLPQVVPPSVVYGNYVAGEAAQVRLLQTDTGRGVCGMDAHLHRSDNLCHRDGDDSALHILPVPTPEVN